MKANILVVDDEPDIIGLVKLKMRKQIRSGKYEFSFAGNGQEALEIIKRRPDEIDVVVSDINMPMMDGITLVTNIFENYSHIKSIMMTAYGDMPNIRQAMKNGVHDYLLKPVNFEEFEITIDRAFNFARKEKQIIESKNQAKKELEEANKRLENAYKKEKALNKLKSNFVSMVSHEYREPLSAIQSSSDVLKTILNGSASYQEDKFINQIEVSVRTMSDLLDEVVYFEELEKEDFDRESKACLDCLVKTIISEYELTNPKKHKIYLTSAKTNIKVCSEENLIYLILNNILSNSIKFSSEGSIIFIKLEEISDHVIMTVEDQGIGIPENEIEKLFEPFSRCSNAAKIPGTGLGMSIVNRALDKIEGDIEIKSEIDKGTTVKIKFRK